MTGGLRAEPPARHLPGLPRWIDLVVSDEAARQQAAEVTGLRVPALSEIVEIESSSRLRVEDGALYLSSPYAVRNPDGTRQRAAIGFVISPDHLMTVRTAPMPALAACRRAFEVSNDAASSIEMFAALLEAIVDRLADLLERTGAQLDQISTRVFHDAGDTARGNRRREDAMLRAALHAIGHAGETVSNVRDSLLGISRIVLFVTEAAGSWLDEGLRTRMRTVRDDVASLNDYDMQITGKVQFLLDATLGFLNIAQNNGIKILTVVSLVGIPPTLVASIYGMNFKNMPELNWTYGYEYGLTVIVLSVVLPLLFFKWRGWL